MSLHSQLFQKLLVEIACSVILGKRLAKRSQILCVLDSLEDIIAHEVRGRSAIVFCTSLDGGHLIVRQFCLHLCHQLLLPDGGTSGSMMKQNEVLSYGQRAGVAAAGLLAPLGSVSHFI